MPINLFPLFSYVVVSTFTPGPSNISSASLAVMHGYKKSLVYQFGLATGVLLVMCLSGWISSTLLRVFPAFEPVLRYLGAAYVLYLAYGILKASYFFTGGSAKPLGFLHGLMLQALNAKLLVYAFTLFSAFLAPITGHIAWLGLAAVLLAAVSFAATSTWAIFGTAIKTYLHNPRLKTIVNVLLSLSLVYTAIAMVGLG
jgi:cysteine/O-acetylserine efflux protein